MVAGTLADNTEGAGSDERLASTASSVDSADSLLRNVARVDDVAPAEPPLEAGAVLGHFRVVRELGRGGMGIVYLADDTKLRRQVALKVLPPALARNAERRRSLLREARAAAAVTHPNIATVYEVGESGEHVYIAMEHVGGEGLRARMERAPLTLAEVLELARPIARALGTAHRAGLVHRDLKPENVMLTGDGLPKLLDFGLARVANTAGDPGALAGLTTSLPTIEGRFAGTPAYMSPEQILGDPVDARADVFALGVMLYEMLSGRRPFEGDTASAVMRAIVADPPEPLYVDDVPEELVSLILACLDKDPLRRSRCRRRDDGGAAGPRCRSRHGRELLRCLAGLGRGSPQASA
jgi:serine/threonine-protein kinase